MPLSVASDLGLCCLQKSTSRTLDINRFKGKVLDPHLQIVTGRKAVSRSLPFRAKKKNIQTNGRFLVYITASKKKQKPMAYAQHKLRPASTSLLLAHSIFSIHKHGYTVQMASLVDLGPS